uniref:Differentially expressed in FDCP 8 homolog B n=1 Tax=Phallusia mammillata TaxID=59560 RepID=A0A6F9DAY9_9ASCI|nr:differentially expressed in FDCP 8 homolog B [Phallusia mammillata]
MADTIQKRKLITSSELAKASLTHRADFSQSKVKSQSQTSLTNNIAIVSFSSPNIAEKSDIVSKSKTVLKQQSSDMLSGLSSRTSSGSLVDALSSSHKSNRFNPFNRSPANSDNSCSNTTAESENVSVASSSSLDTSLAELGLTEDYFSHPEGHLRLYTAEEIEIAIDQCKEMILKVPETSGRRKKLVKNLVDLRMKLQDIKEGPEVAEPRSKHIFGHRLRKKTSRSMKNHCDCCSNLIWGMIQVWYKCRECGFSCHSKCVNNIRRTCVMVTAKGNISYQLKICPEVGLSKQQYCCAECKSRIEITGSEEARMCDYSGLYYCSNCHWNDTLVMPARVMHNWDHTPYKVSRQAFQLLQAIFNKPLIDIQDVNPLLFNYVEELSEIRKMREDILKMKLYFLTCSKALDSKLLWKLHDRQHFVDGSRMYSMRDLMETKSGSLSAELAEIHAEFAKHIKLDCPFCQAKGFICEICNSGETLFPFDVMVSICPRCSAVFHVDCFSCVDTMCPRCKRKQSKRLASFSISMSSDEEYPDEDTHTLEVTDLIYAPNRSSSLISASRNIEDIKPPDKQENETPNATQMKARVEKRDSFTPIVSPFSSWIASQQTKKMDDLNTSKRGQLLGKQRASEGRQMSDTKPPVNQVNNNTRWGKRVPATNSIDSEVTGLHINRCVTSTKPTYQPQAPPDVIQHTTSSQFGSNARTRPDQHEQNNPTSLSDFLEYSDVTNTSSKRLSRPDVTKSREVEANNPFLTGSPVDLNSQAKREINPFLESGDEEGAYDDATNPFANDVTAYDKEKNPFCS